ncbi:unnamed protein product [Periconia digitata]|uniref:DJ-1/PfpI domain-containing protein n=1 Tax=Periconia digitata TaxID=1303443 RepID=A0A9W4ULL3_9PLEO|nr:unnamed protein product [Periconia digitata]
MRFARIAFPVIRRHGTTLISQSARVVGNTHALYKGCGSISQCFIQEIVPLYLTIKMLKSSLKALSLSALSFASLVQGQVWNANKTLNVGFLIFPGYEPLDIYGPLEILYLLQGSANISVSTISYEAGPVSAVVPTLAHLKVAPQTIATHSLADAPALDVLIAPGGRGVNYALDDTKDTRIEEFIASRYESTPYVLSVCNGAAWLARAGVLKGLRATTNKATWTWVTDPKHGEGIDWVPTARWIQNEGDKVWTSSGISAGIDMTYAFLKYLYGAAKINPVMNIMEYTPHTDADWDSFSVVHNVPGADKNRSISDCVAPAGYEPNCSS